MDIAFHSISMKHYSKNKNDKSQLSFFPKRNKTTEKNEGINIHSFSRHRDVHEPLNSSMQSQNKHFHHNYSAFNVGTEI